jgi:hypothetical protein
MTLREKLLKETINPKFKLGHKAEAVLKALEKFTTTGEIDDSIVEGFTQHGHWIGVYKTEEVGEHNEILRGHVLPKERRTKIDSKGNIHLLTSFKSIDKKSEIDLPYKSIGGILSAPLCKSLIAPSLTQINGKAELDNAKKVLLPKLRKVLGPLCLNKINELDLPELQEVRGTLNIYRASELTAPKLKEVDYIKYESLPKEQRLRIIKTLSEKSLKSFKRSTYIETWLDEIDQELGKRDIIKSLNLKSKAKEISIE